MKRRPAVIAYDITSNRRRVRAHRLLQAWKLDSQYSVFECHLNRTESEELLLQLSQIIDSRKDKLLFFWLEQGRPARGLTRCAKPRFRKPLWYVG